MKKQNYLMLAFLVTFVTSVYADGAGGRVKSTWNAQNVILPSSQFTPAQTWKAQVMVFNTGQRYADTNYNKVWGTPPDDAAGHPWYAYDYALTAGEQSWQEQTSPFSSDEVYLGQRSSRWITADITGDIYLRRSFTLEQMPVGDVFLTCGHDDAPSEFYLNGQQVFTVSDGWNNDERVLLTAEQKALLKTDGSENVLAVHVHQNWGGAFADCGLYEADMAIVTDLLPTLDEGEWPCAYYLLNSNDELNSLAAKDWTGRCVDEADWAFGYGPFSNSFDKFRNAFWGSERQPLLVRRHFTMTAGQLADLDKQTIELVCSYDEDPRVYLNGTQIWQATGWNDNDYAHYQLTAAQKQLLREGDNVVAVSLKSGAGGGHIDLGLSITAPYVPTAINAAPSQEGKATAGEKVYNLSGQQVSGRFTSQQRGIYIINGKKIIK